MITVEKSLNGVVLVFPFIVGALLSGIFYLTEGSAIPLTLFQLGLLIGLVLFGFKKIFQADLDLYLYGLEKEYLLFLAIIFFSLIYSPERAQGLFYAFRYIVLILMTYLIYNSIQSYREIKIICYGIIVVSTIIAIYNVIEIYFNPEVVAFNYINQGTKLIRSSGTERDPNIFGSNYFLSIMLIISFLGESKGVLKKTILYGAFLIILISVLLTYSRSSWISIFVGALLIIYIQKNYNIILYSSIAFLMLFIASSSLREFIFSIGERLLDIFAGSSDDSSRLRIVLLETAILMWLDSYTFGIGYQGFSTEFKKYHPPQEAAGVYEPHNEYYTVLSELGTFGFVVFLFLLWKIFITGWATVKNQIKKNQSSAISLALLGSFISYLMFFQFLGGMQLHTLLMINIGLLFTISKFKKTETIVAL